jgi:uncharacterized protein (DUF885 family)
MMANGVVLAAICGVVAPGWSCSSGPPPQDADFEAAAKDYLEELLQSSPEFATYLGDHRFDGRYGDYSREGFAKSLELEKRYLARLGGIDPGRLNTNNAVDYEILRNRIESSIFQLEEIREQEWNPLVYNVTGSIYALVARDFAPLEERLKSVASRLAELPRVLDAARANLSASPQVHTETAILQNPGSISLIRDDIEEFLKDAPGMRDKLAGPREGAIQALEAYGEWLEKDLLPRSSGDFRLGEEKFRKKLAFTLHSDLSMEDILKRAEEGLARTHDELYQTALPLHREYFPDASRAGREDRKAVIKAVLTRLADDHPTNETIVEDAKATLQEATDFVAQANLVSLPAEPVEIIVMPEFQRGVSTAYCDSPGPLEKNGETFYAIAPAPESWTPERTLSLFREYNDYMLRDLTMHEAMPGHYLQLSHSNRFRGPTLTRAAFYSGTFVEGWAVYAEQIMVEHGFGGPRVKMQQLKMLTRAILNTILDQKIHAGSMTEQEAMRLMLDDGFQEDGEAAGKWRRATLTSAQLSTYFAGATEINDIRTAYEGKHGPIRDWQAFHDEVLSHGSPPAKYVKYLMGLD